MSKLLRIVAALSLVAVASAALGGTTAKAAPAGQSALPAEVLDPEWTLQYFNNDDKAAGKDVTSSRITIKFAPDNTVSGFGGCNNYSSTYTVSGQQLTISDKMVSTMMACEESVMGTERQYFLLLPTVNAYALNEGKLELAYADSRNTMTFVSGPSRPALPEDSGLPPEVVQTEWTLQHFDSNARAGQDVTSAGITIKFDANRTLAGFAGCNNYNGVYRASGQQLTINENISVTRMACPAAQSTLESRYLSLLPTVKSYTAAANELQLVYGDDGAALVYVPKGQVAAPQPQVEPPAAEPAAPAPPPAAEPAAPAPPPAPQDTSAAMPATGAESAPMLLTLALIGAFVVLGVGLALRSRHADAPTRK